MARLPYLDRGDLPEDSQDLLDRPINLFRGLAHNPAVLRWMHDIGRWIRYEATLDSRIRELAILQVGYTARSEYEFSHHVAIGYDFGVTRADVVALVADSRGEPTNLSAKDRSVLAAARELTDGTELSSGTWQSLQEYFSSTEVLELVFIITHYAQVVRVLGALEIDVEDDYQKYLKLFS